jgi:hypothetical protein
MTTEGSLATQMQKEGPPVASRHWFAPARFATRTLVIVAMGLFAFGLAWDYSTRRYLKGFADAIVPLTGSPEEKTEALAAWFHHEPPRIDTPITASAGVLQNRDAVTIVQNRRLLKICGSASNAFVNLGDAAGLNARRLLLLDPSGGVMHVVAEVQWGNRWVVVNPQQGLVFKDHLGHGLTKEELRDPEVFQDAISRMPGYNPMYTFENTIHVRLKRIPIMGDLIRKALDRIAPGWEEAVNWAYFPENPSLWLIFLSLPLLLLGILANLIVNRYDRDPPGAMAKGIQQ